MKQKELVKKLQLSAVKDCSKVINMLEDVGYKYNVYPLSPEQERLAFLQFYTEYGKMAYICPYEIETDSEEKAKKIVQSIYEIVKKHDIFRMLYFCIQGKIFQTICSEDDFEIENEYYDKSELYEKSPEEYYKFIAELYEKPFKLDEELTIKIFMVKKSEEKYSIYMILHHINHDAWTIGLMLNDIADYLQKNEINDEEYSYLDYVKWKNSEEVKNNEKLQLEYWKNKLSGTANKPVFPTRNNANSTENQYIVEYALDDDLDAKIHTICKNERISESNYFLSVFYITIALLVGDNSLNIGTISMNRSNSLFLNTYGFFANTLVINCPLDIKLNFMEYLKRVSDTSLEALKNQDVSFDKIVDAICDERYSDETPLINAMYGFYSKNLLGQNFNNNCLKFNSLNSTKTAQQALFLTVEQYTEKTHIGFIFNTNKMTEDLSDKFNLEYERILRMVTENSDISIENLKNENMIQEFAEYKKEITEYNVNEDIISCDSEIADEIANLLYEIIDAKDISYDDSLFKLGCNSMSSIQLLEKINEKYKIELQIADIFRFSTVNLLSGYVKSLIDNTDDNEIIFEEF